MEYNQLLEKKYPKISMDILAQYDEPETTFIVNEEDTDLATIDISRVIPEPPPEHEIEGFGLSFKDQYFNRPVLPLGLEELQDRTDKKGQPISINQIWEELAKDQHKYKKEIKWIKTQIYRILNGFWFYRCGQPIYMHGIHYAYCSFWELETGHADYRDRDRSFFLFYEFCLTDTFTFANLNSKGKAVKNEEGGYDMIDLGYRICLGFFYPKHRREGASYKSTCLTYFHTVYKLKCHSGIQAMDDTTAGGLFSDKLIQPWRDLPFFLKPDYAGSTDPKSKLELKPKAKVVSASGAIAKAGGGLGSLIDFATTADRGFYDSVRLGFLHRDEEGKTKLENVYERHDVIIQCGLEGDEITGFQLSTSTVADTNKQGGANYKKLVMDSKFDERDANGQTKSMMYALFIPAYHGRKGYIDQWGRSIIHTPNIEQSKFTGRKIGAKENIENSRSKFMKTKNIEKYNNHCRLYPTKLKHCFIGDQMDSGFNLMIIHNRIDELEENPEFEQTGNYYWLEGHGRDSDRPMVGWKVDPEGRWWRSLHPNEKDTNQLYRMDGEWFPTHKNKFVHSCDPFRFNKTEGKIKSDGGGSTFWEHDIVEDPLAKDVKNWSSNRFVSLYLTRVDDKDKYSDDMLKQCVYWGGEMFPEMNIPDVVDAFIRWGFGGYLRYEVVKGKRKENPGFYLGGDQKIKQKGFSAMMQYIEVHGHRERHLKLLEECRDISRPDDLKKFDAFASCMGALLGREQGYGEIQELERQAASNVGSNDWIEEYD